MLVTMKTGLRKEIFIYKLGDNGDNDDDVTLMVMTLVIHSYTPVSSLPPPSPPHKVALYGKMHVPTNSSPEVFGAVTAHDLNSFARMESFLVRYDSED